MGKSTIKKVKFVNLTSSLGLISFRAITDITS